MEYHGVRERSPRIEEGAPRPRRRSWLVRWWRDLAGVWKALIAIAAAVATLIGLGWSAHSYLDRFVTREQLEQHVAGEGSLLAEVREIKAAQVGTQIEMAVVRSDAKAAKEAAQSAQAGVDRAQAGVDRLLWRLVGERLPAPSAPRRDR